MVSPLIGLLTARESAIIDHRIVLYGVPIPWRTRIDPWEPGRRFVDRQLGGPYLWWRHEHRFEAADHGTRVIDTVEYLPRVSVLSAAIVNRDVKRIFDYRKASMAALLSAY
jgi:ligand-binding SRPBCC domain-containing protein